MFPAWARRHALRRASVITLVAGICISALIAWVVAIGVHHQERQMLHEHATEVALVLNSSIGQIPSDLGQLGNILTITHSSMPAFRGEARRLLGASKTSASYAWLRPAPSGGGFDVIATVGSVLRPGELITGPAARAATAALHSSTLQSTPIFGATRELAFALGPPAAPPGTLLVRLSELGQVVQPPKAASTAPFAEVQVALYGSRVPARSQLIVATTSDLPLAGDVDHELIPVGTRHWLLSVEARGPLVGSIAAAAPWTALAVALLTCLLVAAVVEATVRRRDTALALYRSEHHVAETMQRSLLPRLPSLAGLELAARYIAGGDGQEVGGDWFDVFPVEGGRVGIVIGDVIGHDVAAASAMAQVRAALRAYAIDGERPAEVIRRLEQLFKAFEIATLVTVFYGLLDRIDDNGDRRLVYSNAGHLPPLVREPSGLTEPLSGADSVLLGAPIDVAHVEASRLIPAGSTLVLFTDGLVEEPGASLDKALDRLADAVRNRPDPEPDALCDHLLGVMSRRRLRDDIALLTVTVGVPVAAGSTVGRPISTAALHLEPTTSAPRSARSYVSDRLRELGRPELVESGALGVSELVTNACLHARSEIDVEVVTGTDGTPRIVVTDASPLAPTPRPHNQIVTTGRGLHLLDAAGRWGVDSTSDGGKSVWFEPREELDGAAYLGAIREL